MDKWEEDIIDKKLDYMMIESWLVSDICVQVEFI
jgi:hypothetical protein